MVIACTGETLTLPKDELAVTFKSISAFNSVDSTPVARRRDRSAVPRVDIQVRDVSTCIVHTCTHTHALYIHVRYICKIVQVLWQLQQSSVQCGRLLGLFNREFNLRAVAGRR